MKVGVIGLGKMGKNHARVYSELGHEVVGKDINRVADFDYEQVSDFKKLSDCEAVSICTPTPNHLKSVKDVYDLGIKNLLIEKPVAVTNDDCSSISHLYKNFKGVVTVGHIERFNPAIKKIYELTEDEKIIQMNFIRAGPNPPRIKDDITLDMGVHDFDLARLLARKGCWCPVVTYKDDMTTSAYANYFGTNVTFYLSWATKARVREISILTEHNHYKVDLASQKVWEKEEFNGDFENYIELMEKTGNLKQIKVENKEPLREELSHFIDCIENNNEPEVSLYDGTDAVMIANEIIREYKHEKNLGELQQRLKGC